ncbi:MAG TPA: hypothetical protein HA348_00305 [Thermoplasmata archaeon]|nr:hypothetical protein [Thermoplasmata archaeon]
MSTRTTLVVAVLLAFFVMAAISIPSGSKEAGKAEWTFMVFLNADNNLYEAALWDINEMETAGSTSDVNIIVLLDGPENGDSSILRVVNDDDEETIHSFPVDDRGKVIKGYEVNMGDPSTLKRFVKWVKNEYPASREVLVIWDHGSGVTGYGRKGFDLLFKGVSYDGTDGDYLTIPEIKDALKKTKLDIIGFDACLMQMIEISWLARNYADFTVGSEELVPNEGWDYQVLNKLTENPDISPEEFSKEIVRAYGEYYGKGGSSTQSAIDSKKLEPLVSAIDSLANILIKNIERFSEDIESARSLTHCYDNPYYIDLYDFAKNLEEETGDGKVKQGAREVMRLVSETVVAEVHARDSKDSYGLSIYFPEQIWNFRAYYASADFLDFVSDSLWDEFLMAYYEASSKQIELKTSKEVYKVNEPVKFKISNVGYKEIGGDLSLKITLESQKIHESMIKDVKLQPSKSLYYSWRPESMPEGQFRPGDYTLSADLGGHTASTTFTIKEKTV